ncbi:MAG: tetratricopeptide repeat protein [Bacteroidetes bacterium]|nr:tetratricopeptide repeat protein [Bacteroidota bacterium]
MSCEEINELLDWAEAGVSISDYLRVEELCNEVFAALPEMKGSADNVLLVFKARALRLLSESFARRRKNTEALPLGEEALATAKEAKSEAETAKSIANLGFIYNSMAEYARALEYCDTALTMFRQQGNAIFEARVLNTTGSTYISLGTYNIALEYITKALTIYEALNDITGITHATGSIGQVYSHLEDNNRALEYCSRALEGYQKLGNRAGIAGSLCNIGSIHVTMLDYAQALDYYGRALTIMEEIDHQGFIANVLGNIATVHFRMSEFETLLEQYQRVLAIREKIGDKLGVADQIANIGELYGRRDFDGYNPVKAEEFLLKGLSVIEESGAKHSLCGNLKMVADFYKSEKRWEEFGLYFERYHDLEKEVLSEETQKAAELTEQRRQAAEHEKQIAVERTRAQATEELLHKTLPKSIADRVMLGETRIADHFENASILFADVVGFTEISSKMPPAAVLAFMNFIFEHFDSLAAKHGCERIKTIGDGYMAVCGAPVRYHNHAERLALMALDMMENVKLPEEIREHLPTGTVFHLRIGLHSGEITAGLIGTGKLAYDIYGDTVNTASRMESHGETGKIHCSSDFIEELSHSVIPAQAGIHFIERGEIDIKSKGMMKTYFLEQTK